MAKTYHAPLFVRLANVLSTALLRAGFQFVGFGSYRIYLLTVRGRKSGQPRTVPLALWERNGKRYVACQGVGDWVLNLRAAGEAILTRDRSSETVSARELSSEEAAPILREEIKNGHPFAKIYGVSANSSLEEFELALVGRPVFLLERKEIEGKERRTAMIQPSTRILVLGAGIAGLLFTLRLSGKVARESVQITLVDEADTFTIRPRLHEFATNQRIFCRPFSRILRKTQVQFVQGRVASLDPGQRRVTVLDRQQQRHELEYDYLVYALGSMTDRQNAPGVEHYAYTLTAKGPFSASAMRERLPDIAARGGQVVVCGGGVTGIETATQVASVYPQIKVSLVTRGAFASSWGKSVADLFRQRLVSLGVDIIDQSEVSAVRAQCVVLEGGRELGCDLCIWTAGFVVQPLAREAGLAVNEHDQVLVDPFLHSISHREIYAIGDAALPVENPGVPHVRMSAFTASIMAAHAADCLSAELASKTPKPLSFAYVAQAVALGQNNALFLPLSPDDRPRAPYITGRLGAFTREAFVGFVVKATLAQQRFPGMFSWLGKGRYEQQLQKRTPGHLSQHVHHLS